MGDLRDPGVASSACSPRRRGKDVVELGCGTGVLLGLARAGAARGRSASTSRRRSSRRRGELQQRVRARVPARSRRRGRERAAARRVASTSSLSEYGASIWADPVPLDPGGGAAAAPGRRLVFLRNSTLVDPLLARRRPAAGEQLAAAAASGLHRLDWPDDGRSSSTSRHGELDRPPPRERLRGRSTSSSFSAPDAADARVLRLRHRRLGAKLARRRRSGWRASGELARRRSRSCSPRRARSGA